jgi:ATP-dependent Lon protease
MDHYLDVPFDLSDVLFITTANVLNTIPPALKDRLEVIRFSGYTEDEKFKIAKKFLMEKVLQANALSEDQITISKPVLHKIIEKYTREAGVRELERKMSKIARKVARKIAEEGREKEVRITSRNLQKYLGAEKHRKRLAKEKNELGVATGLAWTQAGGEILFIECALMPGKGEVTLTGQLGDVMKESCKAGLSYARSQWKELGISKEEPKKKDVHVHVPEGAVPKDGPSAGVAIATAIISSLTEKKINKEIGMTGEITLRGKVLEIGGVKEKVIAAHRAGLKKIILPAENEKNLEKVPEDVKKDIEFIFVETLKEVLDIVLVG